MNECHKENLARSIVDDFPNLADAQSKESGGTGYVSIKLVKILHA